MIREFGDDYENIETYIGLNDRYWEEAMKDSKYFLDLKNCTGNCRSLFW